MGNNEQWPPRASVNKEHCQSVQNLLSNATAASSLLRREGLVNFKYDDLHHKFVRDRGHFYFTH
jgi:hypothetical protein